MVQTLKEIIKTIRSSIVNRYLWSILAISLPLLFWKLLSAAFLPPPPDFPWVLSPIEQREIILQLTVYDNQIAWFDGEEPLEIPIMIKNLETGQTRALIEELPCPGYTSYDSRLDMDGDWIVSVFDCGSFDYEVQAFNLVTNELVYIQPPPDAPPEQVYGLEPAIHNEKVVWFQRTDGQNADLYLYDLQTRTAISLTADGGAVLDLHPDIYNNWVVWYSYNTSTADHSLVAYNLVSGEQITHSVSNAPYHLFPRIYDNLIVWNDRRQGVNNSNIYGYDLDTRQEFAIITDTLNQYSPVIDQNLIAYEQEVTGTTSAVYVYDLLTGESSFILEENDMTPGDPVSVQDVSVHDGLVGFYEGYVGPDIIYVARQLPERFYMPAIYNGN